MPSIQLEAYTAQRERWPTRGQHVLAHFDQGSIVVYQAYRASIAEWALDHQALGGPDFSFTRMSWLKPNFLWMMYRCGWGSKDQQTHVLGLRIQRAFFDDLLRTAVASSYDSQRYTSQSDWQTAVRASDVRLQWDPDHLPDGSPTQRRAIQLGLRGPALKALSSSQLIEVMDMSAIVRAGAALLASSRLAELDTPHEQVYLPPRDAAANIRVDTPL